MVWHNYSTSCTQTFRPGGMRWRSLALGLATSLGLMFAPTVSLAAEPGETLAQTSDRRQLIREGNDRFLERNYEAAEAIFRQLLEQYPRDSLLRYKLGNVLFAQYRYEEAIIAYEEAIRLNEDHALAYNALGNLRASQGRLTEAVSLYERALEINEDYADALVNLGRALAQLERFDAAATQLSQALEILLAREEIWQAIEVARQLEAIERLRGVM